MIGRVDTSNKWENLKFINRLTTTGVNVACEVTPGYRVNIRAKASINSEVIAQVENNEPLGMAINMNKDSADNGYYWIKLKNGGYINANNVKEVTTPDYSKDQLKKLSAVASYEYINREARITKYLITTKRVLENNPGLQKKYADQYGFLVNRNLYRTGSLANQNKDLFQTKTKELSDNLKGIGALPVVAIWIIVGIVILAIGITAYVCLHSFNSQAKGDAVKLTSLMEAITKDLSPEDKAVVVKAMKQNETAINKVLQENADHNRSAGQSEGKTSQFLSDYGGLIKNGVMIFGGFWLANKFILNPKHQTT